MKKRLLTALAGIGALGLVASATLWSCQDYGYRFVPDADRQGTHLHFEVQQPSKADMLFVIDNSISMYEEQQALKESLAQMLDFLARQDTSFRIGITSADAYGKAVDCVDNPMQPQDSRDTSPRGNPGNCFSCACSDLSEEIPKICKQCPAGENIPSVTLGWPQHDGAYGRLIAAYDPAVFDIDLQDSGGNPVYDIDPAFKDTLAAAFPTGLNSGAYSQTGQPGVPWVIDRETVRAQAEAACLANACGEFTVGSDDSLACIDACAPEVTFQLIKAYFNSNVNGLGINGYGMEQGVKSALLAVGLDAEDLSQRPGEPNTLDEGIMAFGRPNSTRAISNGLLTEGAWLREDALLAVMFVSDEDDCSVTENVRQFAQSQEVLEPGSETPPGSACYQADFLEYAMDLERMANLMITRKGSTSRVTVGFIGGVEKAGSAGLERRQGSPDDCRGEVVTADEDPVGACTCLDYPAFADFEDFEADWCTYTEDTSGVGEYCDALGGKRYVEFANNFRRKTFDSICRQGSAYGAALQDFARLAILACFQLNDVRPAGCNPNNLDTCANAADLITVKRASREDVEAGRAPQELPMVTEGAIDVPEGGGWYYNAAENQVCLEGLDRLIGDQYDIFVLHHDELTYQ